MKVSLVITHLLCDIMPSICTTPATNDQVATDLIPFPSGSGTTMFAIAVGLFGDSISSSVSYSSISLPYLDTPSGWTKISEEKIASSNTGADDGIVMGLFSREVGAATDVSFTTISGIPKARWFVALLRLTNGTSSSYIPNAGGGITVTGPAVQGTGLVSSTPGIIVPKRSLLLYVGASPDADDYLELDLPPSGMTFAVSVADTGIGLPTNPLSSMIVCYQHVDSGNTGARDKTWRNTGGAGESVGALSSLLSFSR